MVEAAARQVEDYKSTLNHLAVTWNGVSSSMTGMMEVIDTKTLETAVIARQPRDRQTTPSSASHSDVGGDTLPVTAFAANCHYRSPHMTVTYDAQDNPSYSTLTPTGETLSMIFKLGVRKNIQFDLLSVDPIQMANRIARNYTALTNFKTTPIEGKRALIGALRTGLTTVPNLWRLLENKN